MEEHDKQVVDTAQAAFNALDERYWATDDPGEQALLRPQIEVATTNLALARIKLLKSGTLAAQDDVEEIQRIHDEIDAAADSQATLIAAVRFVAFLAKFV